MAAFSVIGDFTRAKAIWDGVRIMAAEVAAGRFSQLLDQMLEKIIDKAQLSVPWDYSGSTSDQWGVGAYITGYAAGFITEQIVAISVGGGLISKAGQGVKAALSTGKLGQITASMVSTARKFTNGAFFAATKHVSAFGSNTVRAVRKALEEVAKVSIDGTTTVGEQIAYLVNRLATGGVTWQVIGDGAFALCVTEQEVLRVGISLHPQLAKLQARLGSWLSPRAVEGFLELWAGRGRSGSIGEYVHYLHEATPSGTFLDAASLAHILARIKSPAYSLGSGAWLLRQFARGFVIEHFERAILNRRLLPAGFATIDMWAEEIGRVISIKSLDVTAQKYQSISTLTRVVNEYVDKVSTYGGQLVPYGGITIAPGDILQREVQLVIRPGASGTQRAALEAARVRAAGLSNPVNLVITEIQ
jgi:hypothetical protein